MRVLICGGEKTQNIVDGVSKKFASGGVDFIVLRYVDEIEDVFNRGEYYDRAIIIEQSWTNELMDTDETSIRLRLNSFAKFVGSKDLLGVTHLFLVQNNESAQIVYEETLNIRDNSVIVVKAPKYSVNFFTSLIVCDVDQFPDSIVYKPMEYVDEVVEVTSEATQEDEGSIVYQEEVQDFTSDLLGDEYTVDINLEDLQIDTIDEPVSEQIDGQVDGQVDWQVDASENMDNLVESQDDSLDFDSLFGDVNFNNDEVADDSIHIDGDDIDIFNDLGIVGSEFTTNIDNNDVNIENVDIDVEVDLGNLDDNIDTVGSSNDNITNTHEAIKSLHLGEELYDEQDDIHSETDNTTLESNNKLENNNINYNNDIKEVKEKQVSKRKLQLFSKRGIKEDVSNTGKVDNLDNQTYNLSKELIRAFAERGTSIVVTGFGGSGASTIAFNLANVINRLGYTVLVVDLDTEGRTQSYISKGSYNSIDPDGSNLMQALKTTTSLTAFTGIVKPGFRLLTMGLGGDIVPLESIIQQKNKLSRFINLAKTSHNFVIYDVPFKQAISCADEVIYLADNIILTVDCSNWGITKAMIALSNIDSDDITDIIFTRSKILLNKYNGLTKLMGRKVKSPSDVLSVVDEMVLELLGEDPGYYFRNIPICGILNYDTNFENCWYGVQQYSDTEYGFKVFSNILGNILLTSQDKIRRIGR